GPDTISFWTIYGGVLLGVLPKRAQARGRLDTVADGLMAIGCIGGIGGEYFTLCERRGLPKKPLPLVREIRRQWREGTDEERAYIRRWLRSIAAHGVFLPLLFARQKRLRTT
ncbi:MAG: hypothetical protein U1E51_02920, partial [Candidatus Binatia bacterium]|nr:hypothetical protein [Candidatus Binatia bacterium]